MNLMNVATIVFLMNVIFGYWRANTKKFSYQWFLSIHIPVPIVIALRILAGIGWRFITFPILIGAFFSGQFVGGRIHLFFKRYLRAQSTSCILLDLVKIANTLRSKKKYNKKQRTVLKKEFYFILHIRGGG